MIPSIQSHARTTITTLFAFVHAQGHTDYLGEHISQLEHSLQCAHLARQSQEYGNDAEVVIAALLHDVGRFIPAAEKMAAMTGPDGTYIGTQSHEVLGERYIREIGFSEKVCELVGAHVMAKRYLVATDAGYWEGLSESSKKTLEYQLRGFTPEQIKDVQNDPWLEAKLAVRRWDDQAKIPNIVVPPLEDYGQLAYECLLESRSTFTLHSRVYRLPQSPTVVICIDGFDPEYLASGIERNVLPTFKSIVETGFHATAKSCMPSFTNPNNKMFERGVRVAAITAKDKLRKILAHGLQRPAICFSAERAADCTIEENGIADVEQWLGRSAPSQYSGDLSLFVLDAGVKLLQEGRSDFLYLTLSDYIQHKHAPCSKEADEFMQAIDMRLGQIISLGATVAVTADHGMSAKSTANGEPNVLFLEDVLNEKFGAGSARVICPITDPFVRHHGALGSFVRVYLTDITQLESMISACRSLPEVDVALNGVDAARQYEMPPDREADIVVISTANTVIGNSKEKHDLSKVRDRPLRSHGGLSEQDIPVLLKPAKVSKGAEGKVGGTTISLI
ncbi:hypothetical protein BDV12DRAFT_210132 [Aspergillus spectabilis]